MISMIQLHGVCRRYRGRRQQPVLQGVDLCVQAGEVVLLSGAAGSGKTTLLELVYAAQMPDSGTVEVFGRDLSRLRRSSLTLLRQCIGVVPQTLTLLEDRSALDNVALALEVQAEPRQRMRARAAEALGAVGLACEADTPVSELSSGQKQLVALARALVRGPSILVADEPTTHMDTDGRKTLVQLLATGAADGAVAVVATNDHRLLSMGAHHGWRHVELHQGTLWAIANRDSEHHAQSDTEGGDYESIEVTVESNVVPFPLAAQAGGLLE